MGLPPGVLPWCGQRFERKGSRARADMGGGADHGAPRAAGVDSVPHHRAVGRALRFGTKILPIGAPCLCRRKGSRHDSQTSLGTKVLGRQSVLRRGSSALAAGEKTLSTIPTGMLLLAHPGSQGSDQIVHVLELGSSRRALHVCPVVANCCRQRLGRTVPCCTGQRSTRVVEGGAER